MGKPLKILVGFAIALVFSVGLPEIALASLLREVTIEEAKQGVDVEIWIGSGTNLDFSGTGEVIHKVWLDDPSRITVDFDGELCEGDGCGAEIIHLRRIEGVDFAQLPETPTTLLTVITRNSAEQTNLYQFRVAYGNGAQQYATVAVGASREAGTAVPHETEIQPDLVASGLAAVINQEIIDPTSPVVARTQDFLARLTSGEPAAQAASNADVSMAVILRLSVEGKKARLLGI